MKIKRIAGFFGIFCALIASTALALRAARIETKWSPRGSWEWELKTDSIISVGCGVNGAHYSPAERHVRFGPLQLHFPPTREAIAAAERRNVE